MPEPKYRKGDWVQFVRDGVLMVTEVVYVRKGARYPWQWQYYTTSTVVGEDQVLRYARAESVEEATDA